MATDLRLGLSHRDSMHLLERQSEVMALIAAGAPLPTVLRTVAVALQDLMVGARCSILLLDHGQATLRHGTAPTLPADYARAIDGIAIGPQAGSCGTAVYLDAPVVAEDIASDPRWDRFRAAATPHGLRACWSTPIRGRNGTVGTFAVYHDEPHRPDARELRLVDQVTHLASVAIDHHGLFGALAESEERFRRAFEDNSVGMALTDLDGRLTKINRALWELLDRPEHELLGAALTDLVTPTPATEGRAAMLPGLSGAELDGVAFEADARRPDGRRLRLAVAASAVRSADGVPVRLSLNLVDVTGRRAAERERRARREAEVARGVAEAASRAKSAFVSALSHELRTPLQAITGFTELLGNVDLSSQQRCDALGHISGATTHILSLVDDVLDIAKIEAGAMTLTVDVVEPGSLVCEVLDLLAPLAAARVVDLVYEIAAPAVVADRRRLRQVLLNVVGNSIRHGTRGGQVRVCAQSAGPDVVLRVADTGPGIPAEVMDRLFVPFDRLGAESGPEQGAGLGLVLARGLIEAMGGRLAVRSVVGTGTTVKITLRAAGT